MIEPKTISEAGLTDIARRAISGRVRSCLEVPEQAPLRYEIGVEFLEMPPEFRGRLNSFVEWLAARRQ